MRNTFHTLLDLLPESPPHIFPMKLSLLSVAQWYVVTKYLYFANGYSRFCDVCLATPTRNCTDYPAERYVILPAAQYTIVTDQIKIITNSFLLWSRSA